jgi:hypothetical protein
MVALNPSSLISGPTRMNRWGRTLTIDLGTRDSTLAISRENRLPRAAVVVTLAAQEMMRLSKAGDKVDNILVVGSEVDPTRHPGFREISENLRALRNKWFPRAKLNLISNDPSLCDQEARITVGIYNSPVVRLEYGTAKTFQKLTGHKSTELTKIIQHLSSLEHLIVQAQFVRGEVDNSTDSELKGWIKRLKEVGPQEVLISTPPSKRRKGLPQGITPTRMSHIEELIAEEVGAKVTVVDYTDSTAVA